jgi:hypothetical protein
MSSPFIALLIVPPSADSVHTTAAVAAANAAAALAVHPCCLSLTLIPRARQCT